MLSLRIVVSFLRQGGLVFPFGGVVGFLPYFWTFYWSEAPQMASSPESPPSPPSDSFPSPPQPPPELSPPPVEASLPPPDLSPPPEETTPPSLSPPPPESESPPPPNESSTPSTPPTSPSPPPPKSSTNTPPSPPPPPSPQGTSTPSHLPPPSPPPLTSSSKNTSPPPPHKSLSGSSTSSSSSSDSSSSQKLPIIIGVAAGAGLLLLIVALFFLSYCKKKKKRRDQMYYRDQSRGKKGGDYYNGYGQNQIPNLKPPPGAVFGEWTPPAPPPPPPHLSSDLSSNFSGSGSQGPPLPPPHPAMALGFNKSTFTYDELVSATGGFSVANLLGQGGFGYVHKGVLPNGKEIAVKSLKLGSGQGDREFQAEVEIISRVHHRHLVSLVGYCIAGGRKMLVYEFVPNNNLEFHLHGKDRPPMDWASRVKIALGSAKGLAYLHEDCHPHIIHRDIKSANILIDYSFEAKVADFGLAKLNQDNSTHVSTRVMGTFGYLAPEYASSGKLTEKSDVFSYGVMLLELITGRRPVDVTGVMEDSLVDWARPICAQAMTDGDFHELVDPRLEQNFMHHQMAQMVACAGACVRHSARRRPKMSQIVRALEGDVSLEDLNEGVKPGQSSYFSSNTSDYDGGSYSADMKRFKKVALNNNEYTSSEYGMTSEYGLSPSSSSSDSQEMSIKGSRPNSP